MKQLARGPTRKRATLGWILTNTAEHVNQIKVSKQKIGDHQPVAFNVDLGIIELQGQRRALWGFSRAKWDNMQKGLSHTPCQDLRGER